MALGATALALSAPSAHAAEIDAASGTVRLAAGLRADGFEPGAALDGWQTVTLSGLDEFDFTPGKVAAKTGLASDERALEGTGVLRWARADGAFAFTDDALFASVADERIAITVCKRPRCAPASSPRRCAGRTLSGRSARTSSAHSACTARSSRDSAAAPCRARRRRCARAFESRTRAFTDGALAPRWIRRRLMTSGRRRRAKLDEDDLAPSIGSPSVVLDARAH
jgi:hypothetical protein